MLAKRVNKGMNEHRKDPCIQGDNSRFAFFSKNESDSLASRLPFKRHLVNGLGFFLKVFPVP